MKPIIEPHIHMISRTTDEYMAMRANGIRVCVEPSFWQGANRRYAGTFFDYFRLSLEFEPIRAARFGVDHWSAISVNPKEAENRKLADEVMDGMGEYLDHSRCVAVGEIGFNNITENEEHALVRQLKMAEERKLPVVLHLPHFNKLKGIKRCIEIIKAEGFTPERIDIDHNVEETIALALESGCYAGMTVYPYSKLSPERVSAMIKEHGHERVLVNGSADWGISDPLSLIKVINRMRADGFDDAVLEAITHDNPMAFYSASDHWQPNFDIVPQDPNTFQRQP